MQRVLGYIRVSTQEQAQHGLGLPVQEQAVVDYCLREGHELVEIFEDGGVSDTYALHERRGRVPRWRRCASASTTRSPSPASWWPAGTGWSATRSSRS